MVLIVDFKMGNLGSVRNMLKKIGVESEVSRDPHRILLADKIILPGVGRFDRAMEHLAAMELLEPLREAALARKVPFLGICLGMQLMLEFSEEGDRSGLGWVQGTVRKFQFSDKERLPIPHMGWNDVKVSRNAGLFSGLSDPRFYFVHSFFVDLLHKSEEAASTSYGQTFVSALRKENLMGVQFHPEKSHRYGMVVLRNFCQGIQ